jgi:uncharacterized protein YueI
MAKYTMTLDELQKLHADETDGGFDYAIISDVRKGTDMCIVAVLKTKALKEDTKVKKLTKANKAAEAAKVKMSAELVDSLGLTGNGAVDK